MNYLFHLYLSGSDPEILTGNFMGDFVKGRLDDLSPPRLRLGVQLHRRIDSFARDAESFNRSRLRIAPHFGLYRGVLVDLFYDHFLALHWTRYAGDPLENYLARTRRLIEVRHTQLPERLREIVPLIFEELLPSYRDPDGVGRALTRMGRRIPRENPLASGGTELIRLYPELEGDFHEFLPAVQRFTDSFLA
ncbi:ACP phosphodiesterase [Geomonas limicola]|uniref:ACP phosphodiesterase n=1 Tax=Geomonas limicola TaxID=2740186 RepID=A0A6V8N235_9BACT|nr:ACP phosphodiesterase [Geomonas limicola]GFO66481.1 ACP phosphodiesterase [Geomonas limicola]